MSESNNTATVQKVYDAFGQGDLEGILNMLTEDVEWEYVGPAEIPFGGTYQGRQQVPQFFQGLLADAEVEVFSVDELVAQGDKVVALGHERWRVQSTGKAWETQFAHVFTVREGKIAKFTEFADSAAVAAAFRQ